MSKDLYNIRDMKERDRNFILATWLRGLFYGDSWFSQIPKNTFMNNYKKIAQALLDNPNITVRIACLKEDQDVILGYSVSSRDGKAVVWVFVKTSFRTLGIGRALLPPNPEYATLLTTLGKTLIHKVPLTFNPFY